MKGPSYELRATTRDVVLPLFEEHHGYKSLSSSMTYCFGVFEDDKPIAAYAWQPPPVGAAKAVCPEMPSAVLSLSRMVAVGKAQRRLKHISKPLRRQMKYLIDRTRWPVLLTYSDEGEGHNGFVYECSGWTPTIRSKRPIYEDAEGARKSSYANGKHGTRKLTRAGFTYIQRWESWICPQGEAAIWMKAHGWDRVPVVGKKWASGAQAFTFVRKQ